MIIDDPTSNDSFATGASWTSNNPELLQSDNKTETETPEQIKIKEVINALKDRIVKTVKTCENSTCKVGKEEKYR